MDNITETTLLFDDSKFYLLTDKAKAPIGEQDVLKLKSGYCLVMDDDELFYTGMDFPQAPKNKLHMFIHNYLLTGFPAEAAEHFGYIKKGDRILISLFRPELFETEEMQKIFEKAGKITSPLAIRFAANDTFAYTYDDTSLSVEDGLVTHIEKQGQKTPKLYKSVNHSSYILPFLKIKAVEVSQFIAPAVILAVCFLLFILGSYFRLSYNDQKLYTAQKMLDAIYLKAGVLTTPDPMGALMSKAEKKSSAGGYRNLFIIDRISKAQEDQITATSIEIVNKDVTYVGLTKDYANIEAFRKQLKEDTGAEISLLDTKKTDQGISFTLRFQQ